MDIDVGHWNPEAVALFQKAEQLTMPLVHSGSGDIAVKSLMGRPAKELFPNAKAPGALLAGLLLRLNCWNEAHEVAQDISSPEGSYWHAIVHRMEPDYGNAGYWFRRVDQHPIFPELLDRAAALSTQFPQVRFSLPQVWKPDIFSQLCEEASHRPGSERERLALEVQQAEWELLMKWCA